MLVCARHACRSQHAKTRRDNLPAVNVDHEVIQILRSTLNLAPQRVALNADTALLGHIAELDSMAVVSILTALEERFGFSIDDDEVDGRTFESVASLSRFVREKIGP
jgi:acyl carrier protein